MMKLRSDPKHGEHVTCKHLSMDCGTEVNIHRLRLAKWRIGISLRDTINDAKYQLLYDYFISRRVMSTSETAQALAAVNNDHRLVKRLTGKNEFWFKAICCGRVPMLHKEFVLLMANQHVEKQ